MDGKPADKPGSVPPLQGSAIIPLGLPLPTGSSNLPGSSAGHASASLFGLAPDGVYRAVHRYRERGGLLPRRFTLACAPCDAIGGLLSVALSVALGLSTYSAQPLAGILPNGARTFLPVLAHAAIARPTFRLRLYAAVGKTHGEREGKFLQFFLPFPCHVRYDRPSGRGSGAGT